MNETDDTTRSRTVLDADDAGRERLLDEALAAIRETKAPPGSELAAGQRVARALGLPATGLSGLTDYEALIPDYLAGRLNDALRQLFEDEARTSIPLRRALAAAHGGEGTSGTSGVVQASEGPRPPRGLRRGDRRWTYAIAAALAVAVGAVLVVPKLDEPGAVRLTRVDASEVMLWRHAGTKWLPLAQAEEVEYGQKLATKNNGSARIELEDGSKLEIAPRSQLHLVRQRDGNRIRVDRGSVIVQAAPQRDGTFDVVTDDFVVAVTGTTFGVSHGTKGSRVSVIEGEVEVQHGRETTTLRAGDQYGTRRTTAMALEDAVAWSRDADRYAEMLRAYADLQRDIGAVLTTESRHSRRLLDLVPASTTLYVAVPNAPATIAETYAAVNAFRDRLPPAGFPESDDNEIVEEMVGWLGQIGDHLGSETVVALGWEVDPADGSEGLSSVLLLAEADEGVRGVIENKLAELARVTGKLRVEIVDQPGQARQGWFSVWLNDGLIAVSTSPALLVQLEATLDGARNPFREGELHARLAEVYERGVEYLAGADLKTLGLDEYANPMFDFRGASTAIAEHRIDDDRASATLEVRFDDDNPHRIALLDRPGPMGALKFFSPDAKLAGAVVLPDSESLRKVLASWLESSRPGYAQQDAALELVEGLVSTLGGEIAVALDGPLLPAPSWKAVVEVYDQARLQQAAESWAVLLGLLSGDHAIAVETLEGNDADEPVYRLVWGAFEVHYAYIDGYLVLTPSRALLDRARQTYRSGVTLLAAGEFQELLPQDSYLDFSAVAYTRLDDLLALPLGMVQSGSGSVGAQILGQLRSQLSGAAMFGVYNEPDRIRVVANGSNIAPFLGLPMLPALGGAVFEGQEDGT